MTEQRQKPKYLPALECFAAEKGITVNELREQLDEAGRKYPLPDCLEPWEMAQLAEGGELAAERMAHLKECGVCAGLVEVITP